jgi:hypothetical protein
LQQGIEVASKRGDLSALQQLRSELSLEQQKK